MAQAVTLSRKNEMQDEQGKAALAALEKGKVTQKALARPPSKDLKQMRKKAIKIFAGKQKKKFKA